VEVDLIVIWEPIHLGMRREFWRFVGWHMRYHCRGIIGFAGLECLLSV
jgi:hypothetical protein